MRTLITTGRITPVLETVTTARGTYRIRAIAIGRNFGHYAQITLNGRRRMHETDTHATPAAAIAAAARWIDRQA